MGRGRAEKAEMLKAETLKLDGGKGLNAKRPKWRPV
jgi:hypothetical protein